MEDNPRPRAVFLYPGNAAEDDYSFAATLLDAPIDLEVVHTEIGEDAHREDALRDTGDIARLRAALANVNRDGVVSIVWACTSGSFVFGSEGAREQARALAQAFGVPSSSTSLAFVDALEALGIHNVAVAATYPTDIARLFINFLADAGVETHNAGALGILSGAEVGTVDAETVLRFAEANDVADAEAILLPDTALHTIAHLQQLEEAIGKPVLTANQVSVWQALRLAAIAIPQRPALGHLFSAAVGVV